MPLPVEGVENHRRAILADIVKGRTEALAGELEEAGADPAELEGLAEPPNDDPRRPQDVSVEDWAGMSDEEKGNAIASAETAAKDEETDEQRAAREAEEKRVADEAAAAAPKKVKIKVDGQEREVDENEVLQAGIRALQKESAADKRLEDAARMRREAEEATSAARQPNQERKAPPANGAPAVQQLTDQDYLETVKQVQYGTPEEASAALKTLVSKAAHSGQTEDLTLAYVNEMLDFREAMQWTQDEFKDIFSDPNLKALFSSKEKELRAAGDMRPYREVYQEIGTGLRDWMKGKAPAPSAPAARNSVEARRERKANIVTIPQAAARQPAPTTQKAQSQSEIIEQMRKARHQA